MPASPGFGTSTASQCDPSDERHARGADAASAVPTATNVPFAKRTTDRMSVSSPKASTLAGSVWLASRQVASSAASAVAGSAAAAIARIAAGRRSRAGGEPSGTYSPADARTARAIASAAANVTSCGSSL